MHELLKGECTDGEWNTLRYRGNSRPLSILQIRTECRNKYRAVSKSTMMDMLSPTSMFLASSFIDHLL